MALMSPNFLETQIAEAMGLVGQKVTPFNLRKFYSRKFLRSAGFPPFPRTMLFLLSNFGKKFGGNLLQNLMLYAPNLKRGNDCFQKNIFVPPVYANIFEIKNIFLDLADFFVAFSEGRIGIFEGECKIDESSKAEIYAIVQKIRDAGINLPVYLFGIIGKKDYPMVPESLLKHIPASEYRLLGKYSGASGFNQFLTSFSLRFLKSTGISLTGLASSDSPLEMLWEKITDQLREAFSHVMESIPSERYRAAFCITNGQVQLIQNDPNRFTLAVDYVGGPRLDFEFIGDGRGEMRASTGCLFHEKSKAVQTDFDLILEKLFNGGIQFPKTNLMHFPDAS